MALENINRTVCCEDNQITYRNEKNYLNDDLKSQQKLLPEFVNKDNFATMHAQNAPH